MGAAAQVSSSVVVIGNFDGVHPGHREVLRVAHSSEPHLPLVVVTFWPHPMSVLRPGHGPVLLSSLPEREALLRDAGADQVIVVDFTPEFSQWSPERFLTEVVEPLHPARVVVGENFRFGKGAAGSAATLREFGRGRFEVTALKLVTLGDEETCSTRIRQALGAGQVHHAAEHLGRPFRFSGVVIHGDRRGRDLGYPTANLPVPPLLACPADGVYAGWVTRQDGLDAHGAARPDDAEPERWPAAISVGTNPTFDGLQRRVEAYVLDRTDLMLYDAPIAVDFCDRIRGQVKFDSVDALIAQMHDDVAQCRALLVNGCCAGRPF